jgi:hypothetical protein
MIFIRGLLTSIIFGSNSKNIERAMAVYFSGKRTTDEQ